MSNNSQSAAYESIRALMRYMEELDKYGLRSEYTENKMSTGDEECKLFLGGAKSTLPFFVQIYRVAAAYAVDALKEIKNRGHDSFEAWRFTSEARYWSGMAIVWSIVDGESEFPGTNILNDRTHFIASALAKLRHREHYDMAEMVREYWRTSIDHDLSAQKAADEVIKANLVNLSHKKIAEIISALRREGAERK